MYGAAALGIFVVNRNYRPIVRGWAIIVLGTAALALGGCGRKGGLDLPPNAQARADEAVVVDSEVGKPSVFDPSFGSTASPPTPKGPKRAFVLDPLLGN